MRQTGWFLGDTGRLCDAILCQCAIGKPVIHAEYFLADIEADRILTHSRNDAGELMSRYGAATSLAVFTMCGGIPQHLRWRHTSRVDVDQQFASLRVRLRNVFFDQHRWLRGIRQAHYSHFSPLSVVVTF